MSKNKNKDGFRQKFLKHPGPLGKPLTNKSFKHELKSMRKLEFGPQQRLLKSEKRASNVQQQRIGDWFPQYLHQVGRINANVTGAYNQAVQGSQQDAANTSAYAEKLRQRVASDNAASAASRGATVSPAADQTAVQANVSRRTASNAGTDLLRSQGASQHAYFADKKAIGKGEEISQLLQEAARGRQVNQDLQDLNTQKKDFADKFLHDTRGQQQDFYLGLLQAQLGNKQAKLSASTSRANAQTSAQASIANSKRTARSSAKSRHQQASQFNKTHTASGQSKGTKGSGSSGGHSHKHETQRAVQHMFHTLQAHTKGGHLVDSKGHKLTHSEVLANLLNSSQSYSQKEAKAALKKWRKKHSRLTDNVNPF